jgi:hypothetical protein
MKLIDRIKPAASRNILHASAGLMWTAVGVMLCSFAYRWLSVLPAAWSISISIFSLALAGIVYRFGFSKVAWKNIHRLNGLADNLCIFAFMPWKSYLLVAGMMTFGILLRSSSLPRSLLAVIYITVGAALFLSSFLYYSQLRKVENS